LFSQNDEFYSTVTLTSNVPAEWGQYWGISGHKLSLT